MKTKLITLIFLAASSVLAQYAPATGGSTILDSELDSKPAFQLGVSTGLACTAGKDMSFAAGVWSFCTVTGNPGTWVTLPNSVLVPANNLSDIGNAATARTNLGLGTVATKTAVGTVGSPGSSANVPTEDAVRSAIAGVSGGVTDFVTTKTSGTVVTVAPGHFRYGTNLGALSGTTTFTLNTLTIASISTGSPQTLINTTSPITGIVLNGQAVNVQLTGTGSGCAGGNGVFVASISSSTSFQITADTHLGCTGVSGTVGATAGGTAIIFGNTAGQLELSHSASTGALVSVSGAGAIVTQTSTGTFPNGSIPIASISIAVGAFGTVTDLRAFLSNTEVQAGPGVDVTMFGGQPQVSTASNIPKTDAPSAWTNFPDFHLATKTLPWRTGTGSPDARDNCTYRGEAYFQTDTPALWTCTVTGTPGTWAKVQAPPGTTPYTCVVSAVSSIACTHSLSTTTPWVSCYDGSGNMLGSTGSTTSVTSIVATSSSVATITFSGSTTGTCVISTGSMGPAGAGGAAGTGYKATSVTSLATGTGSKTLTTQTGLAYVSGSCVEVISAGTPADVMIGLVTAYNTSTGSLTFTSAARTAGTCSGTVGSATHADWNLSISGYAGADGGGTGTVTSVTCQGPLGGGVITTSGTCTAGNLPSRSACIDFGTDNASADLVDADLGPQGNIVKIPVAATIIEVSVTSNAGTPSLPILQKNHWGGSSWSATDITSAVLPTGASGIETCAATGSACVSGVVKSGSVTVVTAASANVVAAGDYIQAKTGSGFASSGAKRVSACVTYTVN